MWKIVGYILQKQLIVESNLCQKFKKLLHQNNFTLGLSVRLLEELLSKMDLSLSRFSFSVIENYSIICSLEYSNIE